MYLGDWVKGFRTRAVAGYVIASTYADAVSSVDRDDGVNLSIGIGTYRFGNYHSDDPAQRRTYGQGLNE